MWKLPILSREIGMLFAPLPDDTKSSVITNGSAGLSRSKAAEYFSQRALNIHSRSAVRGSAKLLNPHRHNDSAPKQIAILLAIRQILTILNGSPRAPGYYR